MLTQPVLGPLLGQSLRLSLHLSLPLFTAASSVTHGVFFLNIQTATWGNSTRKRLFPYFSSLCLISASVTNINIQCNTLFMEAWKHFKKALWFFISASWALRGLFHKQMWTPPSKYSHSKSSSHTFYISLVAQEMELSKCTVSDHFKQSTLLMSLNKSLRGKQQYPLTLVCGWIRLFQWLYAPEGNHVPLKIRWTSCTQHGSVLAEGWSRWQSN